MFFLPPNGTISVACSESVAGLVLKYSECMISSDYQKVWEIGIIITHILWVGEPQQIQRLNSLTEISWLVWVCGGASVRALGFQDLSWVSGSPLCL